MPLYLLPNLLGPIEDHKFFLPNSVDQIVPSLDGLIAESEKGGRRYLSRFKMHKKPSEIPIALLNEHTRISDIDFLLEPLVAGENWGVVADAGLPCLADPGASLVLRSHERNIAVKCFSGPSSITHSLMLSGLSGQRFNFYGYIARHPQERKKSLQLWERTKGVTHLFIEVPYRNVMTVKSCLETLQGATLFCIASQLTLPDEWVATKPISMWKKENFDTLHPHLAKKNAIFLLTNV